MKELIKFEMPLEMFAMEFSMGQDPPECYGWADSMRKNTPKTIRGNLKMIEGEDNIVTLINSEMLSIINEEFKYFSKTDRNKLYLDSVLKSAKRRRVEIIVRVSDDEV